MPEITSAMSKRRLLAISEWNSIWREEIAEFFGQFVWATVLECVRTS